MKAVVIFAHPNPESFNAAILGVVREELAKHGDVKIKDLYAMNWNPVLSNSDFQSFKGGKMPEDIVREQDAITWADLLVFIGPVWWYSVPAIMKGYIDRVFCEGFAYEYGEQGPRGLLNGKRALLITTSDADGQMSKETGMIEAITTTLVDAVFGFCGFDGAKYKNCFAVTAVSDESRQQMLDEIREFVGANA
jgi:NAD(P)H dehydrogenase (quinone)